MTVHSQRPLSERGRRFGVLAFGGGAAVVTVWTVMIAFYAAPGARVVWTGFDAMEAAAMAAAAWLVSRRDVRGGLLVAGLAAAMVCDAWFDVATARPGYRPTSLVMAVALELPFAAVCALFALRFLRTYPSTR